MARPNRKGNTPYPLPFVFFFLSTCSDSFFLLSPNFLLLPYHTPMTFSMQQEYSKALHIGRFENKLTQLAEPTEQEIRQMRQEQQQSRRTQDMER